MLVFYHSGLFYSPFPKGSTRLLRREGFSLIKSSMKKETRDRHNFGTPPRVAPRLEGVIKNRGIKPVKKKAAK